MVYFDSSVETPSGCEAGKLFGAYPVGGLLPEDGGSTHGTPSNSQFFAVNANPGTNNNDTTAGTFCGYQSPFTQTANAPFNPIAPAIAGVFSTGSTISIKFKLAAAGGSCQNGPYIQTAQALISIAQVCTPTGASADALCGGPNQQTPLVPAFLVNVTAEGSSTPPPVAPFFKGGNNQYQFSLSLKGYPAGIYSLTTSFIGGNTTDQTVLFQVQ